MDPLASQIVSRGHLSPAQSMFFVDVVASMGLLVVAAVALRRSLRQGRVAGRAGAPRSPQAALAPGEAVVMGTVELEEGSSVAVRVEVEQEGIESESSGVWSHQWIETDRKVCVRPFRLRHASGARIRVEPGPGATCFNALKGVVRVDLAKRVRVAEIMPGEKVFVLGDLQPASEREGRPGREADDYVLGPPPGGRMLLSSAPIADHFAQRAAFHRRWAFAAAALVLAFNACFAAFHARRFLGHTTEARVTQLRSFDEGDDEHFSVTMQAADSAVVVDEVSRSDFRKLREGDGILMRDVPAWRSAAAIGPRATAHSRAYLAVPLLGLVLLVYGLTSRATRPWYERKRLVDKGVGRLAESKPTLRDARAPAADRP